MGVGIKRQAKMPTVDGGINGLLHGAQQHGVNLLGIGPVFGGQSYLLEFTGSGILTDGFAHPHHFQVRAQDFLLLQSGAFVYPEQTRLLPLRNELCRTDIGSQHGLLNQPVCFVAGTGHNFFNAPQVITHNLGFSGFKIHRAPRLTGLQQRTVNIMQVQQLRHDGLALSGLWPPCVGQNGSHFGVSQPGVAEHHCRIELVGVNVAFRVDQHVAHHAQPLYLGVERAQAVRQLFGQHGNHAARKIHAGSPVIGIHINGRPVVHIVADIGNGHQQAPTLAPPNPAGLSKHGIVKVTGIFAINRHKGHIGQIHPIETIFGHHPVRQTPRLCQCGI